MDITLEKIDIIRDRTGVSYKEAKDALENSNGNVVDALIAIEDNANRNRWTETISVKGNEVMDKVKNIVQSGNVNRIRVKKENTTILDIPVTAGALGAVVIPQITAVGTALALLTKCVIEVERPNKEPININNTISNTAEDIANRIKAVAGGVKDVVNPAANANQQAQPGMQCQPGQPMQPGQAMQPDMQDQQNQQNQPADQGTVGCTCGNLNIQTSGAQGSTAFSFNTSSSADAETQSGTNDDEEQC